MNEEDDGLADFTPREADAWGGLLSVHGRLMRLIERDLAERCRISHVEFEVLLRLSWAGDRRMRIQDLAAASVLTRSGISRVVERLERVGLVTRESAPEDRRGAYAIVTDSGLATLRTALDGHVALVRERFLSRFGPDELEQMAAWWRRLEPSSPTR